MTPPGPPHQADGAAPGAQLRELPDIVASIVETARRGRVRRLTITHGDFHLELESAASEGGNPARRTSEPVEVEDAGEPDDEGTSGHTVTSPMVGTFYVSPAPGEAPFVRVGDRIAQGDTIGIVEAMKIMNEIAADRAGVVVDILATDGETVEYGSPLVRIDVNPQ